MGRITFLLALGVTLLASDSDLPSKTKPKSDADATVTVTAEADPVEVAKTPNPVVVVDGKTIEASGASNLGDLLQDTLPGQVLSTGGPGTAASIYLGGSRPQDTVVTLNGFRLTDAAGMGGVNTSLLGLIGVDRVEIQQGPSSTRFGSDALGGVVALYTPGSAPKGFSGGAALKSGSHDNTAFQFTPAYGWDTGWVRAAIGAEEADPATQAANTYRAVNSYLGYGQQLGESTLLTFDYLNAYTGVPIPIVFASYGTDPRPDYAYNETRDSSNRIEVYSGALHTMFSPTVRGEFSLGQITQDRMEPLSDGIDSAGSEYTSRRNQFSGNVIWDITPVDSLQVGTEAYEEFATTPDAVNELIRNSAKARHLALLLEGAMEPITNFRIVGSLRTQRDQQIITPQNSPETETQITQITGKLGVNWQFASSWRIYASAGTGFSNPLLSEALWNSHYGGDPLDNEKSRSYQAGITYQSGPWQAGLELSRTLFSSLVYYDPNGGVYIPDWYMNSGVYRNGSDIRIQSAEISGGYGTPTWGVKGFYRNQEARDQTVSENRQLKTDAVVRRPFQSFGFMAYAVMGWVRLDARWSWFGSRYEYGLPDAYRTHFNDLSLSATLTATPALSFTLRGDHLLQRVSSKEEFLDRLHDFQNDAEQVYGFPATPPTWTLEARYRF
jgi:outer membrane cobalamin receptor